MREERGQTAAEYAVVLGAIVTVAVVVVLAAFSGSVYSLLERVVRAIG